MADTLSLKWLEGNDIVTLTGGTHTTPVDVHISGFTATSPTFNVDNPYLWSPLSVLSGLASGFCERRAVLNDDFVTAAGVSVHWLAGAPADRDQITENCMNNMALGKPVNSLFYANTDATFAPFGSAAASNYMTTMDAALTTLVSGSTTYVDANGGAFALTGRAAFDGVASSATATANAQAEAVSSITLPVSNGGATLKSPFLTALPVEWAKERKWMLDELRYTPTFKAPINSAPSMGLVWDDNNYSAGSLQSAIDYVKTHGSSINPDQEGYYENTAHNYQTYIYYKQKDYDSAAVTNSAVLASNLGSVGTLKCPSTTVSISSGGIRVDTINAYNIVCTSTIVSDGSNYTSVTYTSDYYPNYTSLTSALVLVAGETITGPVTVSMYIGHPKSLGTTVDDVWLTAYMNSTTYYAGAADYISGGYIKHSSDGVYENFTSPTIIIPSGGTVTLESGTRNAILVEPGGTLNIKSNGVYVSSCCVMTGGTVFGDLQQSGTLYKDTIENFFSNFQLCYSRGEGGELYSAAVVISGVTKSFTQTELDNIRGICISSGGTAILSGRNFKTIGSNNSEGHIRICSGGLALIAADQGIPTVKLTGVGAIYSRSPENDFYQDGVISVDSNVEAWANSNNDVKYTYAHWSNLTSGYYLYDKYPDYNNLDTYNKYLIESVYRPLESEICMCQVLTGGTMTVTGAEYADLIINFLNVESFASCTMAGNCITGDTWLASGGTLVCDSNVRLACRDYFSCTLEAQDGGILHVTGATCMNDLFKFRCPSIRAPRYGIMETTLRRFDTYNLATLATTPVPLSSGWNVVTADFGTVGTTACVIYNADLTNYNPAPITENVYRGINNSGTRTDNSDISIGFSIKAIKVASVLDNYKNFYIRQFPTEAEIQQAESSATTT